MSALELEHCRQEGYESTNIPESELRRSSIDFISSYSTDLKTTRRTNI